MTASMPSRSPITWNINRTRTIFRILIGTGVGLRLLIAGLHTWSNRSLFALAILHAAFNVSGDLVDPSSDWIRYVVTVLLGLAAVGVTTRSPART